MALEDRRIDKTPETVESPQIVRRLVTGCLVLAVILFVVSIISIGMGAVHIKWSDTLQVIGRHMGLVHSTPSSSDADVIVWQFRVPRVILALLVGMLLAMAGAALQGLLLNPLADPYTVGVSSGAALGAAVATVAGLGASFYGFGVPIAAFVGAIGAMLCVYALSKYRGGVSIHSFLLAGVVIGSFLWAMLTFVMTMAGQDLATIINWLLGSFASPDPWGYVRIVTPFVFLGGLLLFFFARDLNVFSMGEESAKHLGIETEALKTTIIALTSLITAAAVSVSGIIGFVGLIVPHTARRLFGSDHRVLLPTAALLGGILMVIADTAARTIAAPAELPVGVITAMLGAPFFLYLLRRKL